MGLHLEADGGHADRVPNPFLTVNHVPARDDVEDLTRIGDRDGPGGLDRRALSEQIDERIHRATMP